MSEEVTVYEGKTPEIKKQEINIGNIQDQITSLLPLAGTIELTKEQEDILYEPVDETMVEIRPDGLVYLPWMEYATRLRKVFGISWCLIPYGPPKKLGNFIHWGFWLIIKGKPYGFAVGEQQYFENERMSYADSLEGAKSNALMRLCKGLGISLELWKPSFVRGWKEKYAEEYYDEDKKKKLWRKKNGKQGIERSTEEKFPEEEQKQITPEQSALYLTEVIKHLDGYKNIHELRNGYKKHYHEWEENLLPDDMNKVTKHKNELKGKLEEGK